MVKIDAGTQDAGDDPMEIADRRPLAIHEAGHAVVALALGATIQSVEVDFAAAKGRVECREEFSDKVKTIAVCLAGCGAERLCGEHLPRSAKKRDFEKMRTSLSHFFEADRRRAARAAGYRLMEQKLDAIAVNRIADSLLERMGRDYRASITGEDLLELLAALPWVIKLRHCLSEGTEPG